MKVAINHACWGESVLRLTEWLTINGHTVKVFNKVEYIPGVHDVFINVGWGERVDVKASKKLGNHFAVRRCINKLTTFQHLKGSNIPIPEYVNCKKDIPKHWDGVVSRKTLVGRKNKGLDFHYNDGSCPDGCDLYVQEVPSNYEWRIVVFNGEVVGRYHKHINHEGKWDMNLRSSKGFEKMDADAVKAAKALGVDYVGFDVVGKNKNTYWFLEANSAATLQDEAALAITEYINNL